MAGQDLTGLSDVLKEWYEGPFAEQLQEDLLISQMLRVDSENLEGLKAVIPLHYGRSGGIGSRAELAALPSAGKQKWRRAEYDLKYHYARVQVSGPSIQRTKSERGAFLQALKSELDMIRNDLQLDQARQYYGDGTGVIATVASVSTVTVTLSSAEAIVKGYLHPGIVIDLGAPATPTDILNGVEVLDVDADGPTITVASSAAGASAADVIVRHGNVSDTTVIESNDEIDSGLMRLLSDDPVGGINPATTGYGFWQSVVTDVSGSPDIVLDDLMIMSNQLANAGGKNLVVMTSQGLVRRLFSSEDFKDAVRFVNSTTLKGGFEQLSFAAGNGPMTINSDRLHPWGKVSFVDKKHIRVFSPADWEFLARDGLTIRWVQDYDAFQAVLFKYSNMGTDRRNTSGLLDGYTDTGF